MEILGEEVEIDDGGQAMIINLEASHPDIPEGLSSISVEITLWNENNEIDKDTTIKILTDFINKIKPVL